MFQDKSLSGILSKTATLGAGASESKNFVALIWSSKSMNGSLVTDCFLKD